MLIYDFGLGSDLLIFIRLRQRHNLSTDRRNMTLGYFKNIAVNTVEADCDITRQLKCCF